MAKVTRQKHAAGFEAKMALPTLAGGKTLIKLAQQFEVHPHYSTDWKRQFCDRAAEIFGKSPEPPGGRKGHACQNGTTDMVKRFIRK